jgi:hypothetical protein
VAARQRGGDLLGTGLVLRSVGALAICVPTGLTAWALGYDRRTIWFSVVFVLLNLPFFLAQNFGIVFRARDRMNLDAIVAVSNRAVGLLLAMAALTLGLGLGGVLVTQGLAGAVALWLAARLYARVSDRPLHFSLATAREILVGGTAIVTMVLARSALRRCGAALKMVWTVAGAWLPEHHGDAFAPSLLGSAAFPRLSRARSLPSSVPSSSPPSVCCDWEA